MTGDGLHRKLHRLIGDRFAYLGDIWVLIEVLSDTDSVVLRRCEDSGRGNVQQNMYGMPNRRAQGTMTLQISDATGDGYSDDIMVLLEGRQVRPSPLTGR